MLRHLMALQGWPFIAKALIRFFAIAPMADRVCRLIGRRTRHKEYL